MKKGIGYSIFKEPSNEPTTRKCNKMIAYFYSLKILISLMDNNVFLTKWNYLVNTKATICVSVPKIFIYDALFNKNKV